MYLKHSEKILHAGNTNVREHLYSYFRGHNLALENVEEPEIKLPTSTGSSKKQERSRKMPISAVLTMPKPLTLWITINCGKV